LLSVRDLRVSFRGSAVPAVAGLSFDIPRNGAVALVGESGCGKSTTALSIMRLLPRTARFDGEIRLDGTDLLALDDAGIRGFRGDRIGMIFQEPMSSLNPVHSIGDQIAEVLLCHRRISRADARRRAIELLDLVGIPEPQRRVDDFPHRLSGGQRQRVMIAMAIACEPDLLIADEPTTALDATVQARILELIGDLRRSLSMAVLLISHDLPLVSRWADDVVVMHHGEKMEALPAERLLTTAEHPYTRGLIGATLRLDEDVHYRRTRLAEIGSKRGDDGEWRFDLRRPIALPAADAAPAEAAAKAPDVLLSVRDLSVAYGERKAVDGVSFDLARGETIGLVGESGSGKSTLAKALLRLVPIAGGRLHFEGEDITDLGGEALRRVRRHVQMVFQDPFNSLNPRHTVREILETGLIVQGIGRSADRRRIVDRALGRVGLPVSAAERFPHEFSGGQKQRIGIARALVLEPKLIVCDEPVSALDVSIQAQILNLLADLKAELGLSIVFISHDLAVVRYVSDRVIVMKDARFVEIADHTAIWRSPREDYTRSLIEAARS
jgi:peptide/nickel transport system ATP-binding protein